MLKQERQEDLVCVLGRNPEPDETIEDLLVEAIHRVWAVVTEGMVP
jgi:hypothetical protein